MLKVFCDGSPTDQLTTILSVSGSCVPSENLYNFCMAGAVGVILGVKQGDENVAILQVRSETDSFPRACQVTAHGKLTSEELVMPNLEGFICALIRETREELGPTVGRVIQEMLEDSTSCLKLLQKLEVPGSNKIVVTFGLKTTLSVEDFFDLVVPEPGVGFRVCHDALSILPLTKHHKDSGVSAEETRMFPDEMQAVVEFLSPQSRS